jgi:WD40 repeat protein
MKEKDTTKRKNGSSPLKEGWPDKGRTGCSAVCRCSKQKVNKMKKTIILLVFLAVLMPAGILHSQSDTMMILEGKDFRNLAGIAYSPDGTRIAAGYSYKIIIWDAIKGIPADTLNNAQGIKYTIRYNHDGSLILCNGDTTPQLWNANTGELIKTFTGKPFQDYDFMIGVAFSHDEKKIVGCGSDSTISIWDIDSGDLIKRFKAHNFEVIDAQFTLDDKKIISCSTDSTIKIWDAATYKLLKTIRGHNGRVIRLALSPDGTKFASCSWDSTIKLWDLNTYELIRTFYGHKNGVLSVDFSPNGTKLLSGGNDMTVKLWDVSTGKLLHTFIGHKGDVGCVRYSPDSLRIASAGFHEKIIVWRVPGITDVAESYPPADGLAIYPNPATDYIEIATEGVILNGTQWSEDRRRQRRSQSNSLFVYDVVGVCVLTHPLAPSREGERVRLDVSGLTKGVYFVKINNRMYKFLKI